MVQIPRFQEQPQQSGGANFGTSAPPSAAVSFERIQQAFGQWQQRAFERGEAEAMENQAQQAQLAQSDMGTEGVAQAPEGLARRYQQQFDERAQEVYQDQLELDAQRRAQELRNRHWNDPQGFEKAWGEYTQGQRDTIRKQNPVMADNVESYLSRYGQQEFINLADQQAARERSQQQVEMERTFRQLNEERQQDLLNDPDEDHYWGYLDDLERRVEDKVEQGWFSASEGAALMQNNRLSLTREYVRGEFNESLEAGDVGGAQAIIESLQRGSWFEDNETDRRLASQLQGELQGLLDGMEAQEENSVSRALGELRKANNAVSQGVDVSDFDAEPHIEHIFQHGNPNQRQQAGDLLRAMEMTRRVSDTVQEVPVSELPQVRQAIEDNFQGVSESDFNNLLSLVDEEEKRRSRAVSEGDFLSVMPEFEWRRWTQNLRQSDNPQEVFGRTRTQLENRRTQAMNKLELDSDQVDVGLFRHDELADISGQFDDALKRGEFEKADDIVSLIGGVYQGDVMGLLDASNRLDDVSGEMASAVLLSQFGEVTDVTDMLALAGEGRNLEKGAVRTQFAASSQDLRDNSDISEAVQGMAMGNASLREDLFATLDNIYLAQLARDQEGTFTAGGARRNAQDQIGKMLSPLQDAVQFENGTRLPGMYLDTVPGGQRAVKRAVNDALEDPQQFFGRDVPDQQMRFLQPTPLGDGSLGFRHTTENRLMTDENGEPIRINAPEIAEQGRRQRTVGGRVSEVFGGVLNDIEHVGREFKTWRLMNDASGPAQAFGVDKGKMEAVYSAARSTPAEHADDRVWEMMLRPSAEDEVQWDQVDSYWEKHGVQWDQADPMWPSADTGQFRPELDNRQQQMAASANLLQQYEQRFPDDEAAQFAAYWDGPELVEQAQQEHGDRWLQKLPLATQQFVARAQRRRGKDRETPTETLFDRFPGGEQ